MTQSCSIIVERLATGGFRARCLFLPDCEAVATTEEEARHAVEVAIDEHVRRNETKPAAHEHRQV
jgi:predicted RNase H-like HicB family nuclease